MIQIEANEELTLALLSTAEDGMRFGAELAVFLLVSTEEERRVCAGCPLFVWNMNLICRIILQIARIGLKALLLMDVSLVLVFRCPEGLI